MTQLVELIKTIALRAVAETKPMQILYGTILTLSPFQVQVAQNRILPASVLVVPETALPPDDDPWIAGDTLILLQASGGQQYLISGRKGAL